MKIKKNYCCTYNLLPLKIAAASFIFLFVFSCDSFTEVDMPESQLVGNVVFQDIATAKSALADIYARMREGGVACGNPVNGMSLMANYSDDMDFYGSSITIQQFNKHMMLPSNTDLLRLYNVTYGEIYAINALIEGISSSTAIVGEDRNRLLGEAMFLRAFNYFYLVNYFGDIPYTTTTNYEINAVISKTPATVVWQNVINDLSEAEQLLPESYPSGERVRANKACVQAMLARAYLYTSNYPQAEVYATLIINNNLYSVEPDIALLFLKNSPSIIWSFHPGTAGLNTKEAVTFNFSSGPPTKSTLSANLYNAFELGDIRKELWVTSVTNGTGTWYRPDKYRQISTTNPSQEYSIILRLEEQYLIRSEARTKTGNIAGAQQDLNVTRNRAGLTDTNAETQNQLLEAILNERRFEFFTEQSHRWFDLKRTGSAATVLSTIKPGWENTDVLLPLPENELLLNENLLPQNPGY
jgi:hypothetical protein